MFLKLLSRVGENLKQNQIYVQLQNEFSKAHKKHKDKFKLDY